MIQRTILVFLVIAALLSSVYAKEHPISPRMIKAKELRDTKLNQ